MVFQYGQLDMVSQANSIYNTGSFQYELKRKETLAHYNIRIQDRELI
jgi:hypothetical protein